MIGILGSGSWPTALTKILLEKADTRLAWWVREPEVREGLALNHNNPLYLSEALIDVERVSISGDIREVIDQCSDLLVVIPSAFVHKALQGLPEEMLQQKRFHCATKGLIPETNQILTDYLHDTYGVPYEQMSVVSGPSHAEEAAKEKLTYLTVASPNEPLANEMQKALNCHYVKTVYSTDMTGIELTTVMKNIYAIAAGLCHGLGYGDNLIAVMICNAVSESRRFVNALGDNTDRTLERFVYLGDLLVTCYSQHSRNRTFGQLIGHGYTVRGAQLEMNMVAEGYYAVKGVEQKRKQLAIEMPVMQAVYKILYERANARRTMKAVLENLQ
ncbi:MAG: NAD(P)H-dependent glycerol-3-phosphate dehydrogenase [Bacteroidales bacterium]|nr:NAD(P)H-dependent glycerol-3-phosphate dehydrogenase [Bacteroidales bacterium]